jgi:hypothetical protein
VTHLLDEILSILKRKGMNIADLARELHLTNEAGGLRYNQLYNWLVVRHYKPKGEMVLQLTAWRDKQKKYGRSKSGKKSKSKKS